MSLQRIPGRWTRGNLSQALARRAVAGAATSAFLLLSACGDSHGPDGGSATLSGQVLATGTSAALEGATVSIGARQATTDGEGRFELTELATGTATARATSPGYLPEQVQVTINAGANTHDFALAPQEIFTSTNYSVFVPGGVGALRGVIISLGGGVTTSGFVTGGPLEPGLPVLEQSLQRLGESLRGLATGAHVALLGTTIHALANSGVSDDALFAALSVVAGQSGHAELATAPVLTFGLDAGSLEAAGLASRHPERAIGVLVRVPTSVPDLTAPEALAVPTFIMLSGQDQPTVNTAVQAAFLGNRSRGGLWALAVEPGVQHAEATSVGNNANVSWLGAALTLRLPATPGDPLIALDQSSGWLGNQTTLEIAPWADYTGSPTAASWLLSESAATSWKVLQTVPDNTPE